MPRCCSVSGCKTNYRSQGETFSTFSLPKNEKLKAMWLRKIPTDLSNVKNPIICIKHFNEKDIIRVDTCIVNNEVKTYPRKYPRLKEDAVPQIFPNLPFYLSNNASTSRRLPEVEKSNLHHALEQSLIDHKQYISERTLACIEDVNTHFAKLENEKKKHWCVKMHSTEILLCCIKLENCPVLIGSIVIHDNMSFNAYFKNVEVSKQEFPPHMKDKLTSTNNLEELMDLVENGNNEIENASKINSTISILKSVTSVNLDFIVEQLQLLNVPANNRRYNGHTISLAVYIYVCSATAYSKLYQSKHLALPHPRNLSKLISKYSLHDTSFDGSLQYLKTKRKFLKSHELLVNLQLDEIYIEPQLNYKGDSVFGFSENDSSKVAKTVQVFMISSVRSEYKDVISLVPVINLTSEQLKTMLLKIIDGLENLEFEVLSLTSDNNAVNRKAFQLLSNSGALQPSISHPLDPSRRIFILFDSVHLIKCARNNWISRKSDDFVLRFPSMIGDSILVAHFKHLEILYQVEKKSSVRYGHLLSHKVLYPSSIQKQNVKLALKLFNEKTVAALRCIAQHRPDLFIGYEGTCTFLEVLITWWKTVNVKSVYESDRFNDVFRKAIKRGRQDQVQFLTNMTNWLKEWRKMSDSSTSFSSQTFQAFINTNEAFLEMIPYLFSKYDIDYILLGKFQTDDLEGRFGSYRQLSGANYYISLMQVLESERKLRIKSLVVLANKNENIKLKTLLPSSDNESSEDFTNLAPFNSILQHEFLFENVSQEILPILTYLAGYIVMKRLKVNHCEVCKEWLQTNKEIFVESQSAFNLITELDRGKLTIPTQGAVTAVAAAWFTSQKIMDDCFSLFLSTKHQLSVLYKLCIIQLEEYFPMMIEDVTLICLCEKSLGDILQGITKVACKILLNNMVSRHNDFGVACKARDNKKVKKLKAN